MRSKLDANVFRLKVKLLRAFVAGEKLKHFDRDDAVRMLDSILESRASAIAKLGNRQRRLRKAETTIERAKLRQQRRIDMGRDGGLDALGIIDTLADYKPKRKVP